MSKIAWTDVTWNPTVGCTPIAAGCKNCYAIKSARRLGMIGHERYIPLVANRWNESARSWRWSGKVELFPERLEQPLHWRKPRRVFVNSMSDLFHPKVPDEFVDLVFEQMAWAGQHTFQILTKRPERAAEWFTSLHRRRPIPGLGVCTGGPPFCRGPMFCPHHEPDVGYCGSEWPLPNVHLLYSASTQKDLDAGVGHLLQTPAAVRGLSLEPLLEDIGLCLSGSQQDTLWRRVHGGSYERQLIDWVIVGGESGPGARPCNVEWIRSVVEQCRAAGVACFVKQLGSRPVVQWTNRAGYPEEHPYEMPGDYQPAHPGAWNDPRLFPEDLRVQQFPEPPA